MKHRKTSALLTVAIGVTSLSLIASSPNAQTVTESNYRQYATCKEVIVDGKIYSSFGPGPCPPGSKYRSRFGSYSDPNVQSMARTQAAVDAIGQLQQQLLAAAKAAVDRQAKEAAMTVADTFIDLEIDRVEATPTLYAQVERLSPRPDANAIASLNEPLFETQSGYYAECIVPRFSNEDRGLGGWRYGISEGNPACKKSETDKVYSPIYINVESLLNGTKLIYPISVKGKKDRAQICLRSMGISFLCKEDVEPALLDRTIGFVGSYSRSKNVLYFRGKRDGQVLVGMRSTLLGPATEEKIFTLQFRPGLESTFVVGPYRFEILEVSEGSIVARSLP
jgi:hypothetical protein